MRTMVLEDAHQHLPEQFITQSWSKKGSRKGCQKSPWPENDAFFRCVRCTWPCSSHHIINGFPQCCLTSLNMVCICLFYFFWGCVFCFSVWGTVPCYLLHFGAKTCTLLIFGAKNCHLHCSSIFLWFYLIFPWCSLIYPKCSSIYP